MKNKIVLLILILMTLAIVGCCSGDNETNPFDISYNPPHSHKHLVLFGVAETEHAEAQYKQPDGIATSSLYVINTIDGSATLIGDIGFYVSGIAYDAVTKKLYGITPGVYAEDNVKGEYKDTSIDINPQLIEIDIKTGAGTLIADITSGRGFSHPTFDSSGTLFALSDPTNDINLCTIDVINGEANCFPSSLSGGPDYYRGLAFRKDVLYHILESVDYAVLYRVNTADGTENRIRDISGLPHNMAYNGDFHPVTGEYWGLGTPDYFVKENVKDGITQNLLVIDIDNGTLVNTIPTIDNLEAITFGYK